MVSLQAVATVLCLVQLAHSQFYPNQQCICSNLDACVNTAVSSAQAQATTCGNQCVSSLTTGGNNALQCWTNYNNAKITELRTRQTCIENAYGRPCLTTGRKRRAVVQSHHGGGGFGGGFGGRGGGGFGGFGGGYGGYGRFRGLPVSFSGTAATETSNFFNCYYNCAFSQQSTSIGFDPYGGSPYGSCPRTLNCYLGALSGGTNPAGAQACFINTVSAADQTLCTCLQSAYGATSVTCNFQG